MAIGKSADGSTAVAGGPLFNASMCISAPTHRASRIGQGDIPRHVRQAQESTEMTTQLITVDPEVHSGAAVFSGTRVPVKTLFDHLEAGDSLDVFLDDFPSVSRELAIAVLEQARAALVSDAHPA